MSRTRVTNIETAYQKALDAKRIAPDPGQAEALKTLSRLENELCRPQRFWQKRQVHGAYLYGPVGRGKTWLMDLFSRNLPIEEKLRAHFHLFMRQDVHEPLKQLKGQRDPLVKLARMLAQKNRVICFDEFLVEDITDAMLLGPLFEALFAEGVALVATANVPPDGLYRDGLQRERFLPAIAAIDKYCDVVNVAGDQDHRARHIGAQGAWRLTHSSSNNDTLPDLFQRLTNTKPAPVELSINGRPVQFLGASEDSLFMNFAALCEGPRSASDYLELAQHYRTLMVANIPVFNDDNFNAARRFISLVDVLYEAHTVLIASAAAMPNELYQGRRFQFEFKRTASRLEEMRSTDWLASAHLSHAEALTPL